MDEYENVKKAFDEYYEKCGASEGVGTYKDDYARSGVRPALWIDLGS